MIRSHGYQRSLGLTCWLAMVIVLFAGRAMGQMRNLGDYYDIGFTAKMFHHRAGLF